MSHLSHETVRQQLVQNVHESHLDHHEVDLQHEKTKNTNGRLNDFDTKRVSMAVCEIIVLINCYD